MKLDLGMNVVFRKHRQDSIFIRLLRQSPPRMFTILSGSVFHWPLALILHEMDNQ